jgi:hypothetical protein
MKMNKNEPKPRRLKEVNGFLVQDVPADRNTAHFTLEDIKQIEDEMDREYVGRFMTPRKSTASSGVSVAPDAPPAKRLQP